MRKRELVDAGNGGYWEVPIYRDDQGNYYARIPELGGKVNVRSGIFAWEVEGGVKQAMEKHRKEREGNGERSRGI